MEHHGSMIFSVRSTSIFLKPSIKPNELLNSLFIDFTYFVLLISRDKLFRSSIYNHPAAGSELQTEDDLICFPLHALLKKLVAKKVQKKSASVRRFTSLL
jgi:hypothetical protein